MESVIDYGEVGMLHGVKSTSKVLKYIYLIILKMGKVKPKVEC